MGITITEGTLADVDSVEPLWNAMVEHHREVVAGQVPVRSAAESWRRQRQEYVTWLREENALLLLARRDGDADLLGYALCRLLPSGPTFDLGPVRGEVDGLAVAAQARGAGVGSALLAACRDELLRRGCTHWSISVAAANTGAVRLYERLGFRPWVQLLTAPLDGPAQPSVNP
jgi:ribosomal protein S18 acetylase RimI-like enzyme